MRLTVLPTDRDVHTGDLTAKCMRETLHRWNDEFEPTVPTAMLRGLCFGKATELWWDDDEPLDTVAQLALDVTIANLKVEGRVLTEGAEKACGEIVEHVHQAMQLWPKCLEHVGGGSMPTIVGMEIPVRMSIEVDGIPQPIASHVDLLLRDSKGGYIIADTKWREDAPTSDYLARNLQFSTYWLCGKHASFRYPNGKWYELGCDARLCWIHASYLRPCGRAQTWVDKATGEIFNFKKGDVRPMEKVVRWVGYANAARQVATDEIANRIRMMRQGHFPTNPDPLGCALCPSQQWCHRFDMDTRR